jgi:hypothetical protein
MQGINSLQDLKARLAGLGVEPINSQGWFFNTKHGCWTMSFGDVYLDNLLIKELSEVLNKKKVVKAKAVKDKVKKKK